MERPIDEIKKAEEAMRELMKAASELRHQVDLACAQNPEETAPLTQAAAALEKEIERIQQYLEQWRRTIQ
jgi:predicted  nucleic acid-binding Zn-ribbon protein